MRNALNRVVLKFLTFILAGIMTTVSYYRYRKGLRERLRMGMTIQQADERAFREEKVRIQGFVDRCKARSM